MTGHVLYRKSGEGEADIPVPMPVRSGLYLIVSRSGGVETRQRVTLL
jgi:hypothetical protein